MTLLYLGTILLSGATHWLYHVQSKRLYVLHWSKQIPLHGFSRCISNSSNKQQRHQQWSCLGLTHVAWVPWRSFSRPHPRYNPLLPSLSFFRAILLWVLFSHNSGKRRTPRWRNNWKMVGKGREGRKKHVHKLIQGLG